MTPQYDMTTGGGHETATMEPPAFVGAESRRPGKPLQASKVNRPLEAGHPALVYLRECGEQFAQSLEVRLSNYLRTELSVECASIDRVAFKPLTQSFGKRSHITLFKIEPLRGVCFVNLHPGMGLAMVDRLMGGPGAPVEPDRPLSEIDIALLDQVVGTILQEWCRQWGPVKELAPSILGHEDCAAYLQTSSPDTCMLSVTLEATLGNLVEYIEVAFPLMTLDPLFQAWTEQHPHMEVREPRRSVKPEAAGPVRQNDAVQLTAGATGVELTARQLVSLKIGDVLPLDEAFATQVKLTFANHQKFIGRLGTQERHWAVEIQDVLESQPA